MIKEFQQIFGGGVNLDLDDLAMQVGQCREIHNLRYDNFDGNQGSITTHKGMEVIVNEQPLPPGTNIVIGAKAYRDDNSIIFFVYNSNKYHSIRKVTPYAGKTYVVLQQGYRAGILAPNYWKYDLNFYPGVRITHINVINNNLFWVNPVNEPNRVNILRAIYFSNGNSMGYNIIDHDALSAAKAPPLLPPVTGYGTDLKRSYANMLRGNNYQFRYSYVYTDGDISTTSPVSRPKFAVGDFDVYGGSNPMIKQNNKIDVSVETGGVEVKKIRLYVQVNNSGDWKLFKEVDKKADLVGNYTTKNVSFYGTELGYPVDQGYVNRLFSNVPLLAKVQEFIDNKYLLYGGITIGRDYLTTKNITLSLRAEKINTTNTTSGTPTTRNLGVEPVNVSTYVSNEDPIPIDPEDPTPPPVPETQEGVFLVVHPPTLLSAYATGNKIYIEITRNRDNAVAYINDFFVTDGNRNDLPVALAQVINMSVSWVNARVVNIDGRDGVVIWERDGDVITVLAQESGWLTSDYSASNAVGGVKIGATTSFGIVYADRFGKLSGTNEITSISIPWYSEMSTLSPLIAWDPENPGRMHGIIDSEYRYRILVDLNIYHAPPSWAHSFHIVATRPQEIGAYFQTRVKFIKVADDKPYVIMDLSEWNKLANKDTYGKSNRRAYIFTQGDRVRIITHNGNGANLLSRYNQYLEVEILGYDTNEDGSINADKLKVSKYKLVNLIDTEITATVEIYAPVPEGDTKVYQEILSLPIISPGDSPRHSGTINDQDGVQPARITLDMVNVYHHPRQYWETTGIGMVEDTTYSDFAKSIDSLGLGRTSLYDKSIKTAYRNAFIYSEAYFDNSNINGLSMFPPDSRYKPISEENGLITSVRYSGNTLMVWMQRGSLSIYVGKAGLAQAEADGREIVVSTDKVLSSTYPSAGTYGTTYPESVVLVGRNAYFFDKYNGAIVKRSVNGMHPISDMYGIRKDIKEISKLLKDASSSYVISGYNPKYKEVYFTFVIKDVDNNVTLNKTWVFGTESEDKNEFKLTMDLKDPTGNAVECFTAYGDEFYSFVGGTAWLHDATDEVNYFYGSRKSARVSFIVNPDPSMTKTFDTVTLLGNARWTLEAFIKPDHNSPLGMKTKLRSEEYLHEEGVLYSDLHGNMINPHTGVESVFSMVNGEPLRGRTMTIELSLNPTEPVVLSLVKVGYRYSGIS